MGDTGLGNGLPCGTVIDHACWIVGRTKPDDFCIATGVQYSVRDFVNFAWGHLGKTIRWEGEGMDEKGYDSETGNLLVAVDKRYFRPTEVETLLGDPSKAKEKLGWVPEYDFNALVDDMMESDLKLFSKK